MIKFKFIVTEFNNPIGIILNPHSADVYENVFKPTSEDTRRELVQNLLFTPLSESGEGVRWVELFDRVGDSEYPGFNPMLNDIKANFRMSVEEFNKLGYNQTTDKLLHKDYAILKIDDGIVAEKYYFYQIENITLDASLEGAYIFEASLDIYMTFFNEIKAKDGIQALVKRAHIDRLDDRGFYDFSINNIIENNLVSIEPDYRSNLKTLGNNWDSSTFTIIGNETITRKELEDFLNSIKWEYFYRLADINTGTNLKYFEYSQKQGFKIYFGCFITSPVIKDWKVKLESNGKIVEIQPNIDRTNYWRIIDNNELARNHITSYIPFFENVSVVFDFSLKEIIFNIGNDVNILIESAEDDYQNLPYLVNIQTVKKLLQPIQLPVPHIVDITENSEISMETVLFNSQFFKIEYGIANHSFNEFGLDYLVLEPTLTHQVSEVFNGYSFQPDINEEWIVLNEFIKGYNLAAHNFYKSSHGSMRVLSNDNYDQYLKTSQASSMTSAAFKAGMVGIGAGIGLYKGFGKDRGLGRGGTLAAGALVAGGLSGLAGEIATRSDMKSKPDELKGGDNVAMYDDWNKNGITMYYNWKTLNKGNLSQVNSFLKQFGKEVNTLMNFNEILASRYYYNFIQCEGVFNILDNQLSTKIKQQIDTDFKKGIRFWHYRNKDTFKGVGNYKYENLEMKILKNSYVKISALSAGTNEIYVNLDIYNNPSFNTTTLVVEYSLDNQNWIPLTQEEITNKTFTILNLTADTLYKVYVRTNNTAYINNPVQKTIRTERANISTIIINLPTYGKPKGRYYYNVEGNITSLGDFFASDVGDNHERKEYCTGDSPIFGALPCSTNNQQVFIGGVVRADYPTHDIDGHIQVCSNGNTLIYDLEGIEVTISSSPIPFPFSSDIKVQYEIIKNKSK